MKNGVLFATRYAVALLVLVSSAKSFKTLGVQYRGLRKELASCTVSL